MICTHIFTANSFNDIVRRCAQKFGDDRKLVDMVFSREKRLSIQHFGKDTTGTPDIHLDVVFLPCKHNFGSTVVSS